MASGRFILYVSMIEDKGELMYIFISFISDEEGASMAEYALLLGLITVAIATVVTAFGTKIGTVITSATNVLN